MRWHSLPVLTFSCRRPSYLIADNVVFLTIADKSYPRKLAFSYLDELSKEFATTYGPKVETVRKPYAFVGFGKSLGARYVYVSISLIFVFKTRSCPKPHGYTETQEQPAQRIVPD